jgi:fibronectin-binding autotransporter adhesin
MSDTIDFSSLFDSAQTITLTGGQLTLTGAATTTINGPSAAILTVTGGKVNRVFDVQGGSAALSGLTISGGRADRGGGIRNERGTLALDHIVLRNNGARLGGGLFNNGTTTLNHVIISNNTARTGAGLFSTRAATLSRPQRSNPAATGQIRPRIVGSC